MTPFNTVAVNAPVRVCLISALGSPCSTAGVLLYSDSNLSQKINNPWSTSNQGVYSFYVNASQYTLPQLFMVQVSTTPTTTYTQYFLAGLGGGGGGGGGGSTCPANPNNSVQVNGNGTCIGYATFIYTTAGGLQIGNTISGDTVTIAPQGTIAQNWNLDDTAPCSIFESIVPGGSCDSQYGNSNYIFPLALNGVCNVGSSAWPGADLGQKINAAALSGCQVIQDFSLNPAGEVFSTNIFAGVTGHGRIELGPGAVTISAEQLQPNFWQVEGTRRATFFLASPSFSGSTFYVLGDPNGQTGEASDTFATTLENMVLNCNDNTNISDCTYSSTIQEEAGLEHDLIQGCMTCIHITNTTSPLVNTPQNWHMDDLEVYPSNVARASTTSTSSVSASATAVTIPVTAGSAATFTVGLPVLVDSSGSGVYEIQTITAIPDANDITVAALASNHTSPFPVVESHIGIDIYGGGASLHSVIGWTVLGKTADTIGMRMNATRGGLVAAGHCEFLHSCEYLADLSPIYGTAISGISGLSNVVDVINVSKNQGVNSAGLVFTGLSRLGATNLIDDFARNYVSQENGKTLYTTGAIADGMGQPMFNTGLLTNGNFHISAPFSPGTQASKFLYFDGLYNDGATDGNVDEFGCNNRVGSGTPPGSSLMSCSHISGITGIYRWSWPSIIMKFTTIHSLALSDAFNTGFAQMNHNDSYNFLDASGTTGSLDYLVPCPSTDALCWQGTPITLTTPGGTPTYTAASGAGCGTTASYSNTNTRGSITIGGGTYGGTATACTINWSATLQTAPRSCIAYQNGGGTFYGIGTGVPSTSGVAVTNGVSISGQTVVVNYDCGP